MAEPADTPKLHTLIDWLERRLDDRESERVAQAVERGDEQVVRTVAWLREFLDLTGGHPLDPSPPPIIRQRLGQHFRRWSGKQSATSGAPDAGVVAELLFDSRVDSPRTAVRSSTTADATMHLAYASPAGDLVLDVTPIGSGLVRLEGQVLAATGDPIFEARLTSGQTTVRSSDGDEHGRFELAEFPAMPARLVVTNGVLSIIADVDLGGGG